MKLHIQIPHGYRKLRVGERVKAGDLAGDLVLRRWIPAELDDAVGHHVVAGLFIRRVRTPGRGKR